MWGERLHGVQGSRGICFAGGPHPLWPRVRCLEASEQLLLWWWWGGRFNLSGQGVGLPPHSTSGSFLALLPGFIDEKIVSVRGFLPTHTLLPAPALSYPDLQAVSLQPLSFHSAPASSPPSLSRAGTEFGVGEGYGFQNILA